MRPLTTAALLGATLLLAAPSAEAQRPGGGQRYMERGTPVRLGAGLPDWPGGFTFCRLAYQSVIRDSSGGGWTTDFPEADRNLSTRLGELTPTPVSSWSFGEAGFAVVEATDPDIYRCPFLMATDVGELGFHALEVEALRNYLLKGGFFWADDFWGSEGWDRFAYELSRVFPEYPLVDLPMTHPLFSVVYDVTDLPQIPSINSWRNSGGATSELGFDSRIPHIRALMDESGRILVLITHNTDISDGWEREGYDPEYFLLFSPDAYAVGVNVAVWTMTNR